MEEIQWRDHTPDEVKNDPELAGIIEKATEPDIGSLIKSFAHSQRRLGSSINLPGKPEEVDQWKQDHMPKLFESGVLAKPPGSPEEYGLTKPENMAEGTAWNPEIATKFTKLCHSHGASTEFVSALHELYGEALNGGLALFNTSKEEGIAKLKEKFGDKYEETAAEAGRFMAKLFITDEQKELYAKSGLANHPDFLEPIMTFAMLSQSDSSALERGAAEAARTRDEVRAEHSKVMNDKTHPMYELYRKGDKKANDYVDDLYKKAFGTAKVDLGTGVVVTGKEV